MNHSAIRPGEIASPRDVPSVEEAASEQTVSQEEYTGASKLDLCRDVIGSAAAYSHYPDPPGKIPSGFVLKLSLNGRYYTTADRRIQSK